MQYRRIVCPVRILLTVLLSSLISLIAQTPPDRITSRIDDHVRITLRGNTHPLARPENEVGAAPADRQMERMILTLTPDAGRQRSLAALLENQQNPHSTQYHQWLTPEAYGREYGISDGDLAQVVSWLRGHGLEVEAIAPGRQSLLFSGSVAQVEAAFHTEIRAYNVHGEQHFANANDPEIPRSLAGVVGGVVALHDFHSRPAHGLAKPVSHVELTSGSAHYLAPADFAAIYDVAPLYQNSIDGTGQSVAVVARCNLKLADVQAFRSYFGLAPNNPNVIVNGADPGIVSTNEQTEAELDAEWAGAVAKNASVQFVVSGSTSSSDGAMLSAQYIVNNNVAPVMTMSFGLCEAALGTSANSFLNSLWQQAAAEGITVLIAAGDSGAAGCDAGSAASAVNGPAVNGICSTPYSTCVGGTEFNDLSNPGAYWSSTSDPNSKVSALQYIPENVWNESGNVAGGADLWSGGGGVSSIYAKPAWQTGAGVPADGMRDVPDVSVTAASHDGYAIYLNNQLYAVAGTSASTPSLAGVMAMAVEKTGGRLGNANPALYALGGAQQNGGTAVFHDVTTGNNSVPGVTGENAGVGYDLASGLGSVDAAMLVNNWPSSSTPALQMSLSSTMVSVVQGTGANVNLTVGISGGFNGTVLLSASGLPAGVTATFAPASLAAPGSGVSALNLAVGSQAAAGSYTIELTANGGTVTQNAALNVTITPPGSFTVGLTTPSVTVKQGASAMAGVSISVAGGFSNAVALSATGLPSGVTASFVPATLAAPGAGSSTLLLSASAQAAAGNYPVQVTATGGGVTQSQTLTVTVAAPSGFTLSAGTPSVTLVAGTGATASIRGTVAGSFSAKMALAVTGQTGGMTAKLSATSFAAPGAGTATLTISTTAQTAAGSYTLVVTATGGGTTGTVPVIVTVTPPPTVTISAAASSAGLAQGGTTAVNLTIAGANGFNAPVTLTATGLPSGVSAGFLPATLAAPGSGASLITFSATNTAAMGTRIVTITASGGGLKSTTTLSLTVTPLPVFALSASAPSMSLAQGATGTVTLTVAGAAGFNSNVTLSATGLASGVSASFLPQVLSAPGSGSSVLTLTATGSAAAGNRTMTITATGGGITKTMPIVVTVTPPPGFTLGESVASATVTRGSSANLNITLTATGGFNAPVTISISGLPAGAGATFSTPHLSGSTFSLPLQLAVASNATVGTYPLSITASGGGITHALSFTLKIK